MLAHELGHWSFNHTLKNIAMAEVSLVHTAGCVSLTTKDSEGGTAHTCSGEAQSPSC